MDGGIFGGNAKNVGGIWVTLGLYHPKFMSQSDHFQDNLALPWLLKGVNPDAPRCGAHARSTGEPCKAKALPNGRCRNHGGMSTGPKTLEGRNAISKASRQRMASGGKEKALAGLRAWLDAGGREKRSKQMAWRHWKRNPLYTFFGIIPSHLR